MKMTTVLNLLVGACIRSWNAISRLSFYGNSPWEQVSSPGLERWTHGRACILWLWFKLLLDLRQQQQ